MRKASCMRRGRREVMNWPNSGFACAPVLLSNLHVTRALNQAVRRNGSRFPEDFMFQLTEREATALRSQVVILEKGRGRYSKYAPLVFTEHGIAMLSSVLTSKRAVQMNIVIMR